MCSRTDGGAMNSHLLESLWDSVVSASGMRQIFSMQCCGTHNEAPGQLVLGGVDPELYSGDIHYTPTLFEGFYFLNVTRIGTSTSDMVPFQTPSPLTEAQYEAAIKQIGVELAKLLTKDSLNYFVLQRAAYYVDSGNTYLGLDEASWQVVSASINGAAEALGLGAVLLPLHSTTSPACVNVSHLPHFPDVLVELEDGVTLRVPPTKYFQKQNQDSECLWPFIISGMNVLGMPVLETYYTVYDQEDKRVGFATVSGCSNPLGSALQV